MNKPENKKNIGVIFEKISENKGIAFFLFVILFIALAAVIGPFFLKYSASEQDLSSRLSAPSLQHWFGTDELGRDVFVRVLYGTRVSLFIAFIPTTLAVLTGGMLGILAAWRKGWADVVIMWLCDTTLAIPSILLCMVILYTFGGSFGSIVFSLVIMEWGGIARVVRSVTLSLKEQEYILAARMMGVNGFVSVFRHIIPNLLPTVIVLFTLNIPTGILSESALSFLGIGIQPPRVSLGLMVSQSKPFLFGMPWLAMAPSGMIMLLVLAFNFLGDGLRDVLDPRLSQD